MRGPSYRGLKSSSARATAAAKGSSKKTGTKPELLLRKALWRWGLRYRVDAKWLPGRPDVAFTKQRIAIFVDGDFWHGRNLSERLDRLSRGHNAAYWMRKIEKNVERDAKVNQRLAEAGWHVARFWESDVRADPESIAAHIAAMVAA